MTNKSDGSTAANILRAAIGHMDQRAATYDKPEGERSMGSTVLAFAAITGVLMTEEQGWLFMALLKAVRSQQGAYRADSYEDGAAYFALAGEAAARDRNGGWTPEDIKASALSPTPANFGQQHTIEPASLIDDESPRMQAIGQNGPSAEHYAELDRLRTAADFADDLPVTVEEAVELGGAPAHGLPRGLKWDSAPAWASLLLRCNGDQTLWWCAKFVAGGDVKSVSTGACANLNEYGVGFGDDPARYKVVAARPCYV